MTWQHLFSDVYKYENGNEIQYTVEEEKIEGYVASVTGNEIDGYSIKSTAIELADIPDDDAQQTPTDIPDGIPIRLK